ncbi:MAG TPA: substrate-binding domain-containing protein [Anaerohalosphaeraceae bacterium]|nr:substrate-binding domain-containing protein [Anaerohalosphaeraceae bacterium]HQG05840.1 substrate-binding domain-containing protein [Anaerohalosphaeraceae bacterium]HQI06687.1 substrate-binding domain-containing protein [Anaerohalosphaeraceae bacterium]HQJ67435.1 substrate-binding domain-containing protein [Anaerohalosphaeraceae bacterium]
MKIRDAAVVFILGLSAVLFVSGAVRKISLLRQRAAAGRTIAVIPKGTASMWWEVVRQGAEKAARERGYVVSWTGPEQESDREKQIQAVEDAIVRKVVGIVLGPNDAKALARPVQKIKAAGIPCVIIDSAVEAEPTDYLSFVATDNFLGGAKAARLLGEACGGRGKIVLTKFIQNSASTDARAEGFKETLAKEFPQMQIAAEQYTLGTVEDSRQKTVDMLMRNHDVVGLFAVNQPTTVGAYKAIQNQQLLGKVEMVGFDSDPVLLEGIENGAIEALVVQNPFAIGYEGVRVLVDALQGKKVPSQVPIESMVVCRDNLEEMKQKFPAALGL